MGLSYDLISEFVKITNDKKENTKEGTVYATVVSGTGGKYVRIDGSDLLTPMDTTTDIEDGERVTLMIKDHKAIVTGNVTTPSASTTKVDKVTESVNSVSDRVGTFELVVADKVSTNELEAYKATIEVLIANKATIEDLTATNAKIENLEVKNAEIENLVAEKATIEDLEAVNATIENLKVKDAEIENAVVENLKATTADIKILNADFAQIKTLVNGNLTSDNILSFNLTSEKVTVDNAFIKDAMIDTISAGKINAGKINTNSVSIGSEDGGMLITGSTQQFTDKNGNVRIQIGKDASGDFTFVLYGEDGRGQLINQNGITASAIGDGLIVNNMVSDHAAISGGKLDISSVITEINNDNSTTIKSSKIYLNDQAQSLEVAFNTLKTKVDTIQEVTIQGDLTAIVEQVQSNTSKIEANKDSISTLISEDTAIKKQVTDLQGTLNETETTLNSKYTTLSQNLDGFKTTVADTYATKKSVTDVVDNIEANYSTTSVMNSAIEQKAQEISASVSSTYATKNQVNTLDNNLRTNYSTTQQMESAINVAKEAIDLSVSTTYETKENVETKVTSTLNSAKSYADTKKTEAINTAASDATSKANTAKQEAITSANKTLTSTISNYYTKSQTDSQINVAKEAINLGVSSTYETKKNVESKVQNVISTVNNIKIGGRNLILNSKTILLGHSDNGNDGCSIIEGDYVKITPKNDGNVYNAGLLTSENRIKGKTYTLSFDILTPTKTGFYWYPSEKYTKTDYINANDKWQRVSFTYTQTNNDQASTIPLLFGFTALTKGKVYKYKNLKLEIGNKATDWTAAPEDVDASINNAKSEAISTAASDATTKANNAKSQAISTAATDATSKANTAKNDAIKSANNTLSSTIANYYTKSQTDSQINVAKEAINLGVSTNYETKANVQTKVTSTLNSAKSYADTKKTEAINTAASDATSKANTAKQEAITSANKTLTSTISNYYTKSQTDSQINVAKEAINLGVSSTYETKKNVTTKINNIQIGGRNLFKGYDESEITLNTYNSTGSFTQFGDCLTFNPADYVGKEFTISFYAKSPNGATKLQVYNSNGSPRYFVFHTTLDNSLGNAWKYYTYTFKNEDKGSSGTAIYNRIEIYAENKTGVLVKKIKVELGNKATDWTAAPEDIQSEISTIESETKTIKAAVTSLQLGADSISASVKSLEESMTNTTNGLSSDISRIQDQVNLAMTSNDVKLEIQKEMSKGANKVSTSTGFTFDQNGLNISKTDSEMKTQITENGMKIYKNSDVMLTANNQGVDAKNLHATTYLIIGNNSRMEDFTESGSKRTAVFWIG